MPAIPSVDLALLRTGRPLVRRYLSVCPRTPVFQAQVAALVTDEDTNAVVAIEFDNVTLGAYSDALPGYTLDIGTTAGASDVGQVRVRLAATANTLYIAETSLGAFAEPLEADNWLTVVRERRIWQKLPYLEGTQVGNTGYDDTFVAYVDYDRPYSGEMMYYRPLANIEALPAGWADSGQTYRTVRLDGTSSEALIKGGSVVGYMWDIADGTLVTGYGLNESVIEVMFPVSNVFRYVSLTVYDSQGSVSTRYFPIFVHSDTSPPLPGGTGFVVESDQTVDGREMEFTIFGQDSAADETAIPRGTLMVYWEEYSVDGYVPETYRAQFVGWSVRELLLHRPHRGRYTITVGGPAYWLSQINGFAESFLHRAVPTAWYHMREPTNDKAAAAILRYRSTALDVCNLYTSGVIDEWAQDNATDFAAIKVEQTTLWEQVKRLVEEYSGVAGVDTWGSIWLRRHPCLASDVYRASLPVMLTITEADWSTEAPLAMPRELLRPVGQVQLDGFYYEQQLAVMFPLRARAPGRAPDYGAQSEQPAGQILPMISASITLCERAGHWWAWLNNPSRDIQIELIHPLNVIEPAWAEWLYIDASVPTVRGEVVAGRFVVSSVSIEHSNQPPYHRVSLTVSAETYGEPGELIPIPDLSNMGWTKNISSGNYNTPSLFNNFAQNNWDWVIDFPGWPDIEGLGRIILPCTDGYMYITDDASVPYEDGGPEWVRASMGVSGTPVQWNLNVQSPFYELGSGNIEGWLTTSTGIYLVSVTEANAVSSTLQHTFATTTLHRSTDFSYSIEGHGVCASVGATGVSYIYTSNGGSSWSSPSALGVAPADTLPPTVLDDLNGDGNYIQMIGPRAVYANSQSLTYYMIEEGYPVGWFTVTDDISSLFTAPVIGEIIGFGYIGHKEEFEPGEELPISWWRDLELIDEDDLPEIPVHWSDPAFVYCDEPPVGIARVPGQLANAWHLWASYCMDVFNAISVRDNYTFAQLATWAAEIDPWQYVCHTGGTHHAFHIDELSGSFTMDLADPFWALFYTEAFSGGYPPSEQGMYLWAWYYVYAPYEGEEVANLVPPGCYVSGKVDGRVYTSAYVGDGTGTDGYAGDDVFDGMGFAQISTPPTDGPNIAPGSGLAGEIHVPYAAENEYVVYHAGEDSQGARRVWRVGANGTTRTDITPLYNGEPYAPWKSKFQITTFNGDPDRLIVIGRNPAKTLYAVFESNNGGASWIVLVPPTPASSAHTTRAMYAGDTPEFAFLVGTQGLFGILDGTLLDDRSGNIPTDWPAVGEFIGIVGG